MNFLRKFLLGFAIIISFIIILAYLFDVDYLFKAVRVVYLNGKTTAYLDDYTYFENREIKKGTAQSWAMHKDYNQVKATNRLEEVHKELGTVAYLIIKNDSIWHESYYDGYGKDSKSNSFSMAKTVVTASMFKAIMEGKIKGLDQPVSDYFPEYKEGLAAKLTVGDLSSMSTGMDWGEQYSSAFSVTTRAYFGDMTFEEAFNKTGRIVNVNISASSRATSAATSARSSGVPWASTKARPTCPHASTASPTVMTRLMVEMSDN